MECQEHKRNIKEKLDKSMRQNNLLKEKLNRCYCFLECCQEGKEYIMCQTKKM